MFKLKIIPLSQQGKNAGKYFALVDDQDYVRVSKFKWSVIKNSKWIYAGRTIKVNGKQKTFLLHRFIMNCYDDHLIDHRDGNGLNDQRSNLRIATNAENVRNGGRQRNNTTGFKGVSLVKSSGKYEAQIAFNNKTIHLGKFLTPIEAAKAYNNKAIELHGQFAKLNQLNGGQ